MQVFKAPSQHLEAVCEEVAQGHDITGIVDDMFSTMYQNKGIGLAANQVGLNMRVFVMCAGGITQEFINPVIEKRTGGKKTTTEGCLSFPGVQAKASRYKRVTVSGFDKDWNPIKKNLSGIAAVCAQHEIDHLNGKTIA